MTHPVPKDITRQLNRKTRTVEEAYQDVAKRLGGKRGEQVWKRALKNVFSDLISNARSKVPKRTGKLARRIDVRPPRRRRDRSRFFFAIEFGYFGPRPYLKSVAVEFGNQNVRESASVRRAWDDRQAQAVSDVAAELSKEIDKIASELQVKLQSVGGS